MSKGQRHENQNIIFYEFYFKLITQNDIILVFMNFKPIFILKNL